MVSFSRGMPYYVTKEGLQRIQEELLDLKKNRRKELTEKLQRAISFGDLSENAEYQEAKEEQAFIEGRIVELEAMVEQAEIISPQKNGGAIGIGSTVVVEREGARNKPKTFTIVGGEEAQPEEGRISNESPLGKVLLGHKPGDTVEATAPDGKVRWKIIAVT
ncbi:MAG: transcription elongation factor GreA [Candidatus Terrybacteria bacterium RIFCSPHIGHO2_01_FULL_48_17]|uniref:Transcription elongation factor GreA n=1 Tax=Candidatus Terrybacteria bacterium RIFCSPHIGHO2_01_FULL_48_17 TaxID=1802362 RepID=A0A1G2PHE1_9BACT|nr:MAG: transcription elongation factor GreA [Candidatus Terrybacteria bacterium RIFCSPHIGHO2_01_FULL_48_17]OHA53161.1 MAG: transcription elongation factor GreA [Candidatus Terrybacteria bacterium RIFCSPLOWO2_01_FULL_48_14]